MNTAQSIDVGPDRNQEPGRSDGQGGEMAVGEVRVANLYHRYPSGRNAGPDVLLDVSLDIPAGSSLALLGPSGCGKTTLLRSIAGLERPRSGTITIDGDVVAGPSAWVPPERRQVGMVFQDWALFPHLSVAKNVAYGLERAGRQERVAAGLALVGLSDLGDRMPATLSGGQQQRVALARALAPRPRVLLLDEPFSNLDTGLRAEVRAEVHQLLLDVGITAVFVTHDQEEAFVLGDRVAVMNQGRIVQVDTPHNLYAAPSSRWVAEFVGEASLFSCVATGDQATTPFGPLTLEQPHNGPVDVLLRPEQLALATGDGATVELVEFYGHDAMVYLTIDGQSIRVRTGPKPGVRRGDRVAMTFTGDRVRAFAQDHR
ncbi:MAG: ABC transporter ATP-binding protein [Acidimicrobiales bacterium]